MKDLYIIPECYVDTNLVETLITTEGCNHQKGCNTVVNTMKNNFADDFAVGVIDNDKRQVAYLSEFTEVATTDSLSLKKHISKPHYLIVVSPAMDGFLLHCAAEAGISMEDYGFPSELKSFTTITKTLKSKTDGGLKNLFHALRNVPEMKILKNWLKYLQREKYQCQIEELQRIASGN